MKVLINVPVFFTEQNNIPVIQGLMSQIHKLNCEAVAPSLQLIKIDPKGADKYIQFATASMLKCDIVVTHGNWYDFNECVKITEIARILNIPVIHHSRIENYLKSHK